MPELSKAQATATAAKTHKTKEVNHFIAGTP
jgi:hypothetical protein